MPADEAIVEMTEYQLILVVPESRKVLAISDADSYRLPSARIPQWTRPAEQLQKRILKAWKCNAVVLEILRGSSPWAVVEILNAGPYVGLTPIRLAQLESTQLSDDQRSQLMEMLDNQSPVPNLISRVGWIDEAIRWLESETGAKISSKTDILQYNAGGSFTLLRFRMKDGRDYWLKATGEPNVHEPAITRYLSGRCTEFLPAFISFKPEWNAWLMSGEARSVADLPANPIDLFAFLNDVVESMALVQTKIRGESLELLAAGAFDQRTHVLQAEANALFDFLEEAMAKQISTKVPRLDAKRIKEISAIFGLVCERVALLGIDDSIVHGDINLGNILIGVNHCQFVDWSEAYVGHPLVTLQHLLLLNKADSPQVREFIHTLLIQRYCDVWRNSCDQSLLDRGLPYMPLMAAASALYGRGSWLTTSERNDARRQSYARSLARHMDRLIREPELLEAL
jgi:hypothetical protein